MPWPSSKGPDGSAFTKLRLTDSVTTTTGVVIATYQPGEPMPPGEPLMPAVRTLLTGLAFGESPAWHEDRVWFSNWGAQDVVAPGVGVAEHKRWAGRR